VQICHWSGSCLSPQEAADFQFRFTPMALSSDSEYDSVGSSDGLSDSSKLSIMIFMGALLLVISVICAWLLLRNQKSPRRSGRSTSRNSGRTDRRRVNSDPSSLALQMAAARFTPGAVRGATSPPSGPSNAQSPALSKSLKTLAVSGHEEHVDDTKTSTPVFEAVRVDRLGCPMSM
jgi:hypothetical protein